MHPLLLNRARLGAYLAGWALVGVLLATMARAGDSEWFQAGLFGLICIPIGAVVFLPGYYPCRALPLATTRPITLIVAHLISSLLQAAIWALSVYGLLRVFQVWPEEILRWRFAWTLGALGMFFALLSLAMNYLLLAQIRSEEAERTEQELRVLAREAELKALRAQLNPHFLFNSLNSISALTTLHPAKAREMCVLLADFFRKSLKLGEQRVVKLEEELDLLKAYLSIEQIRFGARLQVEWQISQEALEVRLPALLLQPLVENAIKHGIAELPDGGVISIEASVTPSQVELRIQNPSDPDTPPPPGLGMGLRQVRQRLQGWAGTDIRFEAGVVDGIHLVRLNYPRFTEEH